MTRTTTWRMAGRTLALPAAFWIAFSMTGLSLSPGWLPAVSFGGQVLVAWVAALLLVHGVRMPAQATLIGRAMVSQLVFGAALAVLVVLHRPATVGGTTAYPLAVGLVLAVAAHAALCVITGIVRFPPTQTPTWSVRQVAFEPVFCALELAALTLLTLAVGRVLGWPYDEQVILCAVGLVWVLFTAVIHQFRIAAERPLSVVLSPYWISQAARIGAVVCAPFVVALQPRFSAGVLRAAVVMAACENAIVLVRFLNRRRRETDQAQAFVGVVPETEYDRFRTASAEAPVDRWTPDGEATDGGLLARHLADLLSGPRPSLLGFLRQHLALDRCALANTAIFATDVERNVEMFPDGHLQLLVNLERVNNLPRINKYFAAVSRKLGPGGGFVGVFQSQGQRTREVDHHYPNRLVALPVHAIDFIWRRVCSKLPLTRDIYFGLTRGRNRVLSLTEVLGRLSYSGFTLIALDELDDQYVFVVRKDREAPSGPDPMYGLLFRQRRVGQHGRPVWVYKMRTMHPYAEYLHGDLLARGRLAQTGKLAHDFRVTTWGRVLRRFWIDELPMVINWIRGDLKLVGVRPVSESFFDVYPPDLRAERIKYRPGLIPPFYADLPRGIDEVFASERRYLERYQRSRVWCEVVYFSKAMRNILLMGARSS